MAERIFPVIEDEIETSRIPARCDGPEGSGHPRVYLEYEDFTSGVRKVTCPYCSRTYVYRQAKTKGLASY